MQRMNRSGGSKKRTLLLIVGTVMGIGIGGALAQIVPSTGNGTDIATLLQQFGALFGSGTGTTTTTDTTTGTTTTTQPSAGSGRQPIVEDQFTTTSGGSLQVRRPGIWIQNAMAVQAGESEFLTGDVPAEPDNFFKSTADTIFMNLIDLFTNILSGLNVFASASSGLPAIGGTTTGTGGTTSIPNGTTSGAGTSVPIQ